MTLALRTADVPDSLIARWDARWKLGGMLLLSAGVAAGARPRPAAAGLALGLVLCGVGRVPARDVLARTGLLLLSAAPLLILLPFTADAATAGATALRLVAVGLLALVLSRTTPVAGVFAAAGAVGVPASLVQVGLLAHRYSFLFAGELVRLRRAWRTRGFRVTTSRHAYRTVGYAVGAVAVRGEERAGRVLAALRARGFDGVVRPLRAFRTTPADVLGFAACAAGAAWLALV